MGGHRGHGGVGEGWWREVRYSKWREEMAQKNSLELYRDFKEEMGGMDEIYDNSLGSGLLADARGGVLLTREQRAKFQELETLDCVLCGEGEENMRHVVLECTGLGRRDTTMEVALGMRVDNGDKTEVIITKKRLAEWKRRTNILL